MTEHHTPQAAHPDDATAPRRTDEPTQVIPAAPPAPPVPMQAVPAAPAAPPVPMQAVPAAPPAPPAPTQAIEATPAAPPGAASERNEVPTPPMAAAAHTTRWPFAAPSAALHLAGSDRRADSSAGQRVAVADRMPFGNSSSPHRSWSGDAHGRSGSAAAGVGTPAAGAAPGVGSPPIGDAGPLAGWPGDHRPQPRRPRWIPLAGTAASAALLASFATAGLTGAFGPDQPTAASSSLTDIGESAGTTVPVVDSTSDDPDWERVAASVSASVVAIEVATAAGGGEGSGVIIDDAGHILTNNHVVAGAQGGTVQVTLTDGRLYEASVIGTDASTDLAIIQIDDAPDDLSPAALGDSDGVAVGAPVMAVGNPLGLANTVTTGIVSAVDRPVSASSTDGTGAGDVVVTNAIQIDAAINPGNSGGPLFDAEGRVVGITSSIATLSGGGSQSGSIGLGFAIPVNLAREVGEQLIEDGTAEHAFLGVSLSDGTATSDDVTRRGAVVEQVTAGSPAEAAGLEVGDVIVAIDGDAVGGAESLTASVRERSAGEEAELTVVRDGEVLDIPVTLAVREVAVAGSTTPQEQSDGSEGGSEGESEGLEVPGLDESVPGGIPFDWFGSQG